MSDETQPTGELKREQTGLAPCPFCGSTMIVKRQHSCHMSFTCCSCHADIMLLTTGVLEGEELWNNRVACPNGVSTKAGVGVPASAESSSTLADGRDTEWLAIKLLEVAICPECDGSGQIQVPLGEHIVSHEMAADAGEPSMEGQSMGIEYGSQQCQFCAERKKLLDAARGLSTTKEK